MSTGQLLVDTLSSAQQQGEPGVVIMIMSGRPPVNPPVHSRPHQLEQQVELCEQSSAQVTVAPTPAWPPEEERLG